MVFHRCAPLPSSNLVPFGRCGDTREARSTVAESLVALYRVGTHQIRRRWRGARSSTSQGSAELLCARNNAANLMSDHDIFSSYWGHKERRTGKIRGAFSGMHMTLDGWMLARAPASPAQGLHHHGPRYFNFTYFCACVALRNLDVLIKTDWSVICPLCC